MSYTAPTICHSCGQRVTSGTYCSTCGARLGNRPWWLTAWRWFGYVQNVGSLAALVLLCGLLVGGAVTPGVVAEVLGLSPILDLGRNILATLPLVAWVTLGAPLALLAGTRLPGPSQQVLGFVATLGLLGTASLWLASNLGDAAGATASVESLWREDTDPLIKILRTPFVVAGSYLDVYGVVRFSTSVVVGLAALAGIGYLLRDRLDIP